ncbi:hypothetical protein FG386_002550 [Cryptosporidium ryanae]|uniref:uncharacterized protein n=1 Tax=Cryptosporidium ryanae TaxID=515981 RepID=UPI00351A8048|nr:hypothetical protein FG386_002550 [Cryptosporidium ryanae]
MDESESFSPEQVFQDLFSLLSTKNYEVIKGTIDLLLDQSETEALKNFLLKNTKYLRHIVLFVGSDISMVSDKTMKILVNLSQNSEFVDELCSRFNAIEYIMDNLREQMRLNTTVPYHLDLNLMFISNITRFQNGRDSFLVKNKQKKSLYFPFLLECLLNPRTESELEMVINIVKNCTSCEKGRLLLFETDVGVDILNRVSEILLKSIRDNNLELINILLRIITHICVDRKLHSLIKSRNCNVVYTLCCLIYPDEINDNLRRRRAKIKLNSLQNRAVFVDSNGEYKTINNHRTNEIADEDTFSEEETGVDGVPTENNIPENILKSAVGPTKKEFSQEIFDCILVLSSTLEGRNILREFGFYEILRVWHLYESNMNVISGIESIVHLFVYSEEELNKQDLYSCSF